MLRSHVSPPGKRRWNRPVLLVAVGTAILAAAYVWLQTTRTGHSYDGTAEEIVVAMLQDIRADVEAEDWTSLGSYGVSTFLSWKNEEDLREYVEEELGDGTLGPVDYVLEGVPEDITLVGKEIRFTLLELRSETTCRVVLEKRLGVWHVKDISELGLARS